MTGGVDVNRQMYPEALGTAPGRGRMTGRRIIVVGAGQRQTVDDQLPVGNGRAISLLCAREGATVACVDISAAAAEATAAQIEAEGGKAMTAVADVGDPAAIGPVVDSCSRWMGGFDGLAVVVGISSPTSLQDMTVEQWDREQAVNVRSHMLFAQKALIDMDEGGSIVLMSSLAAILNGSRNPSYETAKAALVSLARSVAVAGHARGLRANAVLPGLMDTPMGRDATRRRRARLGAPLPFGRQGTGWETAYATLFLLSHESSYVNAQGLLVDGGFSIGAVRSGA